jgi:VWFA-related protein
MRYAAIVALAALPLFAQEAPQQQPSTSQFGEKLDVNLVLLDTIVTDSKGNQILGLDKNDFVVKENGVAQSIDNVDYFTNRKLLNAQEENAPFKVEQVKEGRYFVFMFDKPVDTPTLYGDFLRARDDVRNFINKQMVPGDQAAIVAHDRRLKVWANFTADKAVLNKALDGVALNGAGINSGIGEGADRTGDRYDAIRFLANKLKPVKGRKNLVLFSAGILEIGDTVRNGIVVSHSQDFQPMLDALNEANVSVYPINIARSQSPNANPSLHDSLDRLAIETKGEYFRYPVSFVGPLKTIDKTNNGYYMISYYAKHDRSKGGFQRVQVSTVNPEFKVAARPGYVVGD